MAARAPVRGYELRDTAASLLYQFWIHSELIGHLGAAERVLNTPSHHRVHHGVNVEYLDRNHGGILIVWDRLLGTFEPERAPVRSGLTANITTFNPVRIAFHEWAALLEDVRRARTGRERLGYVFLPPGWSPDGSRHTARESVLLTRIDPASRLVSTPVDPCARTKSGQARWSGEAGQADQFRRPPRLQAPRPRRYRQRPACVVPRRWNPPRGSFLAPYCGRAGVPSRWLDSSRLWPA